MDTTCCGRGTVWSTTDRACVVADDLSCGPGTQLEVSVCVYVCVFDILIFAGIKPV